MNSKKSDVKVYVSKHFPDSPQNKALVERFKQYKITADPSDLFGRDVLYDRNPQAVLNDVRHVHIIELPELYSPFKSQFYNTTDKKHLVYCSGFSDPHKFLIIDLLTPNAHAKASASYLALINTVAEKFRLIF